MSVSLLRLSTRERENLDIVLSRFLDKMTALTRKDSIVRLLLACLVLVVAPWTVHAFSSSHAPTSFGYTSLVSIDPRRNKWSKTQPFSTTLRRNHHVPIHLFDKLTHDEKVLSNHSQQTKRRLSFGGPLSLILLKAKDDFFFDARTTVSLIGGQSLLIVFALVISKVLHIPNFGFGPLSSMSSLQESLVMGGLWALPLGLVAALLDLVEDRFPALQDVTLATQRSVLSLLGGTFKPVLGLIVALCLGLVAGIGEELLFRGILQQAVLVERVGLPSNVAIGLASIIFGLLHAVTPLYAGLATLASIYFGVLFVNYDVNILVPMACHALYDVGAVYFAHWTVSRMSDKECAELSKWEGPRSSSSS